LELNRSRHQQAWGHLEVVVECVLTPKKIMLNDIMTHAHISGSIYTPMYFKLIPKGLDPLVRNEEFFTSGQD
jgi:hypothetical protein